MDRRALLSLPVAGLVSAGLASSRAKHAFGLGGTFANIIDVTGYGIIGDGATDNLAAYLSLIASVPSGTVFYHPNGDYRTSGRITATKALRFEGASRKTVIIRTTNPTADVLGLDVAGCEVTRLGFGSAVTKTDGALIATSIGHQQIHGLYLDGYYRALALTNATSTTVRDVMAGSQSPPTPASVAAGGAFAYISGPSGALRILDCNCIAPSVALMPTYGIAIEECGDLQVRGCEIMRHGDSLALIPGAEQVVASVNVAQTFFDNAGRGLVAGYTLGAVVRAEFVQTWFSSMQGAGIDIGALGYINQIDFLGSQIGLNGAHGARVAGGRNVQFNGGWSCGNVGSGLRFESGVSDWGVNAMRVGAGAGLAGNTGYGIYQLAGPSDGYRVTACDLRGNGAGTFADFGTGTHKAIGSNLL